MEMTPSLMGLAVGAIIGLIDYIVLTFMGRKMLEKASDHEAGPQETKNVVGFFKLAAIGSLILFPIIGYFAGPYVFGTSLEQTSFSLYQLNALGLCVGVSLSPKPVSTFGRHALESAEG